MSYVLDIAVMAVLVVTIVFGYRRGFIQSLLQLIAWAISFAVSLLLSSPLAEWLYEVLLSAGVFGTAEILVDATVRPTALLILQVVVFFVLFIVMQFVMRLLRKLLKPISNLPVIRRFDSALGGVLGALKGCIYVLALVSIFEVIANISGADGLVSQKVLQDTWLVSWIAEMNPITQLV